MAMIPRITVLNNHDGYLTTIDNSRPESLHFSNDFLTLYHLNSASTFEATFNKVTNGKINPDAQHLINGNKLTMRYADDDYYFNIVDTDEDEFTIKVTALGAPLELTNSERDAYEANGNMTLEAYIKKFDFENIFHIRKNEIADRQKKLSLSSETMLQRLYTLGKEFNAEIKIVPILNDNHSLKELMLDIYKKDAGDQGIGTYRPEVRLRYGKNVSTIKRKISTINLKTAIKPIGNNDLNLIGYDMDIRDDKNQQLYYSTSGSGYIYAPQAKAQFPSNLNGRNTSDFYAEYTKTFSTDSKAELAQLGLEDLKQMSQPQITYEVDAFYEGLKIGDTIRIDDNAYSPRLMLEARLTKMEICFTNPINNKLTFSNFIELKSEIDPLLIAKMQELADLNKTYNAQILTDNTVVFKNNTGETTLIARVLDGIKDITDKLTITWLKGDLEVGNGKNLRVSATDVNGVQLYRFNAFKDGKLIAQAQTSVADVVDGINGQPGRDGVNGVDGADGENAINAYLTNENITLKADTQGNLKSGQLDLTRGQMVVVDGPTVVTSGVSYSIVNQTGCTATIDSTGNYRLTALNADSASVILRASYKGTSFQKTFNVTKLLDALPGQNGTNGQDGVSPITGYLTNESLIITEGKWSQANGYFNIYQGTTQITNGAKFELVSQTDMTVAINADSGFYQVTECGDFGTAILKATYKGVVIQKQLMAIMNKSGQAVVVSDKPPTNKSVGMLWKNTGTNEGYSTNVTYYWTGSEWKVYLFEAENIKVTNLAALSANLGKITAGSLQSGTDETNRMLVDLQNKTITVVKKGTGIDPITYLPSKDEFLTIEPGKIGYEYGNSTDYQYHSVEMQSRKISLNDKYDTLTISPGSINFSPKSKMNQFQITPENAWELKLATVKYSQNVTLPYGLTGYFERFGRNVYMSIMRKSAYENNFFDAPTGPFIACYEKIPEEFRPNHEVTILLNKFAGSAFYPCALHIKNDGSIYLTNSGNKQNYEITGSGSWAAGYLKNSNNDWVRIPTYDNLS